MTHVLFAFGALTVAYNLWHTLVGPGLVRLLMRDGAEPRRFESVVPLFGSVFLVVALLLRSEDRAWPYALVLALDTGGVVWFLLWPMLTAKDRIM